MLNINGRFDEEDLGEAGWDKDPDFAGIAARIADMEALGATGWWGATDYEVEQVAIMRNIAPLVGRVAGEMDSYEVRGPSPVTDLLGRVGSVLEWFGDINCDESEALMAEVEQVRLAVNALSQKITAHQAEQWRLWLERVSVRH